MRINLKTTLSTIILVIGTMFQTSFAQCTSDAFNNQCAELLDNYIYIKTFNVNHSKTNQTTEHSYVFCKGTSYMITVCDNDSGEDKMILELYDKNKKLVATNYNKKSKKFYSKIGLPCTSTGVYYMKYKSLSGKPSCGLSLIGFKKT